MADKAMEAVKEEQMNQEVATVQQAFASGNIQTSVMSGKLNPKQRVNALINAKALSEERDDDGKVQLDVIGLSIRPCEFENKNTGEIQDGHAIMIIDKDGKSYVSVSNALAQSLGIVMSELGEPAQWKAPVKMLFRLKQRGGKSINTLELL